MLAAQQTNKLSDKMLRQGIPPLLGKPADWEKGRVAIQEPRRQHQNRDYLKYTIKYFWDLIKKQCCLCVAKH